MEHLPTQTTPFVTALLLFEHSTITSTSSTVIMTTKKADGMDATTATGNEATVFDDVIVLDGRKVDWYVGVAIGVGVATGVGGP